MNRGSLLLLIAGAGAMVFALSFVNGWIVHDREVRGEGYRHAQIVLSAWRSVAVPVLTLGAVAAFATAIGAVVWLRRPDAFPRWLLLAGSVLALALIVASMTPIGRDGHASSVDLSAGYLAWIGSGLAVLMVVAAALVAKPPVPVAIAIGVGGIAALVGSAGGHWLVLQTSVGDGRHWSSGSYTRPATGDQASETLTIDEDRFAIADRWAGAWESSGWTVVLVDDPACPDSRGTYHAHGEGEDGVDLRFVKVVDTCRDGARAADLETGIWQRDP